MISKPTYRALDEPAEVKRGGIILTLSAIICLITASIACAITAEVETVCFSPNNGCASKIIDAISKAKANVRVMAYSFTSAPIAKALLEAKKKGISVEVVIDHSRVRERYSEVTFMTNQGIPVYVDDREKIQHNKVILIDEDVVITGSYNFTKAAEKLNAENLLLIRSKELARQYLQNFDHHKKHSTRR